MIFFFQFGLSLVFEKLLLATGFVSCIRWVSFLFFVPCMSAE